MPAVRCPEPIFDGRVYRPVPSMHQKWSQIIRHRRRGITPSNVTISAVGRRNAGGKRGEWTRGSQLSCRLISYLLWFWFALELRSDPRQNGRLLCPPSLPYRHRDRGRQRRNTSTTSLGRNRGTIFEDSKHADQRRTAKFEGTPEKPTENPRSKKHRVSSMRGPTDSRRGKEMMDVQVESLKSRIW